MSRASTEQTKLRNDLTVDQFKELQELARQSPSYDPYCRKLLAIEANLAESDPTEILEQLESVSEVHQTCPRFHYLRARVFETLCKVEKMQHSIGRLRQCLQLIAATGDGDRHSPLSIAFITDQDDVVRSFGEQKRCQQTVNTATKQFDVVTAHSGQEFWFDVTKIVSRQGQSSTELSSRSV